MKLVQLLLIGFFVVGCLSIILSYNLNLNQQQDRQVFFSALATWLKQVASNLKTLALYAIKLDWLPQVKNTASLNQTINHTTNQSNNQTIKAVCGIDSCSIG